ncbi:uncharacterized protein LOC108223724 [Daucus carota subsp. sativus]|uniref:uncharacterized protein LOC108223724 n=1 Tax=Daucus carota subsp. sativus TaxID=79200 RepID=UPI003082E539
MSRPYLLSNCALHFSHSSFFINSLRMYIRYYCSRGRKRVPLGPVPPISKQNVEKRQYVHPTEFDVQYRATDTENSNPNIMISGSSRTKRPASHTSLSTCVLSM